MSILSKLPEIIRECKEEYEQIIKLSGCEVDLQIRELLHNMSDHHKGKHDDGNGEINMVIESFAEDNLGTYHSGKGLLVQGDNLDIMKYLFFSQRNHKGFHCEARYNEDIGYYDGTSGENHIEILTKRKIDLVYIDPPFFSKNDYYAQEVPLKQGKEVLLNQSNEKATSVIRQKAYEDTWENGILEYLKMLTQRFYFIKDLLSENGVLWVHLDWHAVHYVKIILDEIFGSENFINEVIWQYKSGGVSKRYFARKHDTLLFYGKNKKYRFFPIKEKSYNRKFLPYRFKGVQEYQDQLGWYTLVNMKDVWQIDMVGRTSAERTGYATQKPEALLERIIKSCTEEGDLCVDFFGGSGTLAAVADKLGRNWISCDRGGLSIINTQKRLLKQNAAYMTVAEIGKKKEHEKINKNFIDELKNSQLTVRVKKKGQASHGDECITVELLSYTFSDGLNLPVSSKQIPIIQQLVSENPLEFIEYWSVSINYDGKEFVPERYFTKEKNKIMIEDVWEKHCTDVYQNVQNLAIRCIDIFGNSTFQVIFAREFETD